MVTLPESPGFATITKNKIVSGTEVLGYTPAANNILQWQNGGKAVVEGWKEIC